MVFNTLRYPIYGVDKFISSDLLLSRNEINFDHETGSVWLLWLAVQRKHSRALLLWAINIQFQRMRKWWELIVRLSFRRTDARTESMLNSLVLCGS